MLCLLLNSDRSLEGSQCLHLQRITPQEDLEVEGTMILLKGSNYVTGAMCHILQNSAASLLCEPHIAARNILNAFPIRTSSVKFRTFSYSAPAPNAAPILTALTDILLPFLIVSWKSSE